MSCFCPVKYELYSTRMSKKSSSSESKSPSMKSKSLTLLRASMDIARRTKSRKLLVYIDSFENVPDADSYPEGLDVIYFTKDPSNVRPPTGQLKGTIVVPNLKLGRIGLVKISVLLALSAKLLSSDDNIVFLSGKAALGAMDMILAFRLSEESELLTGHSIAEIPDTILPQVFEQALNIAIELANQGREGKPVGTIFVLGDEERVMQLSKQMIINPFKGYEPEERNLLNPALKETIREFSSLDGSFVVSGNGEVLAAGRYLGAAMDGAEIPRGLGSRHIAAAGITALTNAVAIVISESTGDVRIFKNGSVIMTIEKPSR